MLRDSPYQGLRPFEKEDAPFFFGRENETRILSANLRTRPLTLLYGPSGVGKSSVLRAGVIHHLQQLNDRLQLDHALIDDDFEEKWRTDDDFDPNEESGAHEFSRSIVVVTFENWREDPHGQLRDAILTSLEESLPSIFTTAKSEELRELGLSDMLLKIADYPEVMELLIILDQFEQYLVNYSEKPGNFADEFCRTVTSRKLRANFLVSIREDWLPNLDYFTSRVQDFFANSIRLEHMDRNAAEAAIRKPVIEYNKQISEHYDEPESSRQKVILEDAFVDEALNQLEVLDLEHEGSERGAVTAPETKKGRIQASGLQIVLEHVWNKVKNGTPPKLSKERLPEGEAKRIFRRHLNESLSHLGFFEKNIAEKLFPHLVTPSGIKKADTAESLAFAIGKKPAKVRQLIAKLTATRILNEHGPLNSQTTQPSYEITTDALAAPIRNWVRWRRYRRRSGWELGIVAAGLFIFLLGGIGLALLYKSQEKDKALRKQLEQAYKWQRWENIRHTLAESDKKVPYLKSVLRGHEAKLTSTVSTSDGQILTASTDGYAMLWSQDLIDPIRVFGADDAKPIVCATISPDSSLVVLANTEGAVWMWGPFGYSIPLDGIQLRGEVGKHVTSVTFSPNSELLAAANTVGDLLIWNSNTRELVANKVGNGNPTRQISFSPSGERLATASEDNTATIWRTADWSVEKVLAGHQGRVNGLAFSPDERYLATASADGTVRLWDLTSGQFSNWIGHTAGVNSVDFDAAGKRLLSTSDDGTARIWNLDNTNPIELKGHRDKVLSASFSPSGLEVVTASRDQTARVWLARSGKLSVELQGHTDQVTYVSYSRDGKYVLTASDDATARVWFAPESESFQIDTPVIEATGPYKDYVGTCPVIVSFDVSIKAVKGAGSVIYRFRGSDGRIWPTQEVVFTEPDTKYLKWYWRITESTEAFKTFEVIEPKGIKSQDADFKVTCTASSAPPGPTPSPTPATTAPPTSSPLPATASPSPTPPGYRQ